MSAADHFRGSERKDVVYTDCIFVVIAIDRLMDAQSTTNGL